MLHSLNNPNACSQMLCYTAPSTGQTGAALTAGSPADPASIAAPNNSMSLHSKPYSI